ncbi:tail fiber assembly protein [Yersinia wautersii]|uniref:Tail assembly chaperone gp38 n=1 Tax=Yersinia wautersii TaxID=1341643 RepID=A0ABP1Z8M7_9GAMM|nr:tail fiber assembly protein [Yersinia wautersii]CRG48969.1 tail assembly chaperone gp38 [Yersinia wautersii]
MLNIDKCKISAPRTIDIERFIDLTITDETGAVFDFSASPTDTVEYGVKLYKSALAGNYGVVAIAEKESIWTGEVWVDLPTPTAVEVASQKAGVVTQAKLKKSKLISDASDRIEILKDRIELGQDKAAELKLWKSYRIALDDIDVSAAPDIMWPQLPE